jgi:predicted phosphatase
MTTARTELPLLAILDLDQTLWEPSIHQFYARNDKNKLPQAGKDIRLLPDVKPMINTFRARGIKIAIASKIGSKKLAVHLLDSFQLLDKIDYIEIYPNEKTVHIKSIKAKSGVPFQRMILFDDLRDGRYGNCVLVSSTLGVVSVHCPYGIRKKAVQKGLEQYSWWLTSDAWHMGGAVVEEDGSMTIFRQQVLPVKPVLKLSSAISVKALNLEEQQFADIGFKIILGHRARVAWNQYNSRRFRATFGASPTVCLAVWRKLKRHSSSNHAVCQFKEHLLWAMMWLKEYASETVICNQIKGGLVEKTLREWVKTYVRAISALAPHVVSAQRACGVLEFQYFPPTHTSHTCSQSTAAILLLLDTLGKQERG